MLTSSMLLGLDDGLALIEADGVEDGDADGDGLALGLADGEALELPDGLADGCASPCRWNSQMWSIRHQLSSVIRPSTMKVSASVGVPSRAASSVIRVLLPAVTLATTRRVRNCCDVPATKAITRPPLPSP